MKMHDTQAGYSLIELIIYVGIAIFVGVLVVSSYFGVAQTYTQYRVTESINNAASISMQRFVQEARHAKSVDLIQSSFATTSGKLVLNTTDDNGNEIDVTFSLSDGQLMVEEGSISTPLTDSAVTTEMLRFYRVNMGKDGGVRMQVRFARENTVDATTTRTFMTTAEIRR